MLEKEKTHVFYPFEELSAIFSLKLSSAKPLSLEESKICHLGKSQNLRTTCLIPGYLFLEGSVGRPLQGRQTMIG